MERGIITISKNGVVGVPSAPIWMTQFEIADFFGVFSSVVRKAIQSTYKNEELNEVETAEVYQATDGISYEFTTLKWLSPLRSGYAAEKVSCSESL